MKKIIATVLVISASMLLIPLAVTEPRLKIPAATTAEHIPKALPEASQAAAESFKIYDKSADKITEIDTDEYIFGVVAAEMPALYSEEALKAQAVAAYTYACCRRAENFERDYDITTDHTVDQSFITEAAAREKWGGNADKYVEKLKNAVNSVKNYMITFNGKPITAVYHAISSGKTEDCKNVWGRELEYLKPVVSEGDKLSPKYITELSFTAEELKSLLGDEVTLSGKAESYFGESVKTESGTVREIEICSQRVTGARLRALLDLRSTAFDVSFRDEKFVFTVYGYGHGVGMSQYGADYMAKQGSDFKEILTHYYTGCEVTRVEPVSPDK